VPEGKMLSDVWANADLAILAANKGNALVVLIALYYSHKIGAFLCKI
jgi:hypothetical protein